jgi:NAD+ synthase
VVFIQNSPFFHSQSILFYRKPRRTEKTAGQPGQYQEQQPENSTCMMINSHSSRSALLDKTASDLLAIDAAAAEARIVEHIRCRHAEAGRRGIAIGVSGGIDSSTLIGLTARAVGPAALHLYHLPARATDPALSRAAEQVAAWSGADLRIQSIDAMLGQTNTATSRVSTWGPFWYRLYTRVAGETPYLTYLRAGGGNGRPHGWRKRLYRFVMRQTLAGFEPKHRCRRTLLEAEAEKHNWLLLGAADLSEALTGWFVPNGIDDLYCQPISALYKTQVRQMAAHLDMPENLRCQPPSADMRRGLTDALALGLSHSVLDLILDSFSGGVETELLLDLGISPRDIDYVTLLHRFSAWRRQSEHDRPPVDGRLAGGCRLCHHTAPAVTAAPRSAALVQPAG